jgi:hypothetical protein
MPKGSLAEHLDQAVTELLAAPGAKVQAGNAELMPLLRVAERLRALPRQDFKARLKSDLERKSFMAITTEPIPETDLQRCGQSNRILQERFRSERNHAI